MGFDQSDEQRLYLRFCRHAMDTMRRQMWQSVLTAAVGRLETDMTRRRDWLGGLAVFASAAVIALGAGDASAAPGDYLAVLESRGIYTTTPGATSCFDYSDDTSGCSRRFTTADDALHTGNWVCDQLDIGRTPSAIAHSLYTADGLFLSKNNSGIVVDAAQKELCE
ncbi:DUF732 domain-containing protein [Gordonia terrae]